jgi:Tol biopolymer transport system component
MKRTLRALQLITAGLALAGGLHGGVDLIVEGVNLSTDPVAPGDAVPISVTITNVGDADVTGGTATTVRVTSGLANAASLDVTTFAAIPAEGSTTVDVSFLIADTDLNGSYPISFTVDPDDTIVEDNEANNGPTVLGTVNVLAFADLVPQSVELRGEFFPGNTIEVVVELNNAGRRGTLGAFTVRADLEAPSTGTDSSVSTVVAGLAAGASTILTLNLPIDLDNPNGNYTVTVLVDAGNDVNEDVGEGNNEADASFEIDLLPDLRINDLFYETGSWEAGDIIAFSLAYDNAPISGAARTVRVDNDATGRYQIEVVLSTDNVFGNGDDFLLYRQRLSGNPATGGNLLPNDPGGAGFVGPQEIVLNWQQAMPANLYGDFFVLAKIDVLEEQTEGVEDDPGYNGNNVWYPRETAKITLHPASDPQAVTYRASLRGDGSEGDALSEQPALSADGRYLVFTSLSSLVEEDTDAFLDVYRRDNLTGAVALVSRPLGILGLADGDSQYPAVSADGRYVVYQSAAANLVGGDSNGMVDIFLTDMLTGVTTLVSRDAAGGWANGNSARPSISADGGTVVYQSMANDLVAGGTTSGTLRVYAYDVASGATTLLSGAAANGDSFEPKLSGDGAYAVFTSRATNLVGGVTRQQVYRAELSSGNLLLVSRTGAVEGNDDSFHPSINADGSVVAFSTLATNIDVPGGWVDRDLPEVIVAEIAGAAVTPTRLLTAAGTQFDDVGDESAARVGALEPVLSADGSRVLFRTQSTNLLPTTRTRSDGAVWNEAIDGVAVGYTDLNTYNVGRAAVSDLYLFDRATGTYEIASLNTFGYQGAAMAFFSVGEGESLPTLPSSRDGALSADGRFVAFSSDGRGATGFAHGRTNLLSDDNNEVRDVFIRDLRTGAEPVVMNPPAVSISAPLDGASVVEGTLVPIVIAATDTAPGYVESVHVLANGVVVATLTRASYQFAWIPDAPGSVEISAIAVDSDGLTTVSAPVTVTVSEAGAPSVNLSFPLDGQQVWAGQALTLSAQAVDADGRVAQVEFFVNGVSIGVDTAAPYGLSWTPAGVGAYDLVAVATDNTGKLGYSSVTRISVVDATAPTVNVVAPTPGGSLVSGSVVTFGISVTGSSGAINQVEVFVNGTSIGLATPANGAWEIDYTPNGLGSLSVQAVARDSSGNFYGSSLASYTLTTGLAPVVGLLGPDPTDGDSDGLADNTLRYSVPVVLAASANDADGSVTSVEFFVNGESVGLGTRTSVGVYELSYTPLVLGVNTIAVVATDDDGNLGGASLNYNVVTGAAPLVVIVAPDPTDADSDLEADTPLARNQPLTFAVEASDPDGTIVGVEFFLDGESLGLATERTYYGTFEVDFTPTLLGAFTFSAVATDDLGNQSITSLDFRVTEGVAPTVTITGPDPLDADSDGIVDAPLRVNEAIAFIAAAADADGAVESVSFFLNGQPLGLGVQRTSLGTYEIDYLPTVLGLHVLEVVASDSAGNETAVAATYNVVAGSAPSVAVVSPDPLDADSDGIADIPLLIQRPFTFTVEATDADGSVVSVEIFENGVSRGFAEQRSSVSTFEFDFLPLTPGLRLLQAVATDDLGNVGEVSVRYFVSRGSAPSVTVISPDPSDGDVDGTADEALLAGETYEFRFGAFDLDGSLASVQMRLNGVLVPGLREVSSGIFAADFTPLTPGVLDLEIVAVDDVGNETVSTLRYAVVSGAAPTLVFSAPDPLDGDSDGTADAPIPYNQLVRFAVVATDSDGTVNAVRFFANGSFLGNGTLVDSSGVYEISYFTSILGAIRLDVEVEDSSGNLTAGSLIYTVVDGLGFPDVTLLTPSFVLGADGVAETPLRLGDPVEFLVEVTDSDAVAGVTMSFNRNVLPAAFVEADRWAATFTPDRLGIAEFQVRATDSLGNRAVRTYRFSVEPVPVGAAPVVEILSPPEGGRYLPGTALTLFASAYDSDGIVAEVRYFLNGYPVAAVAPPFEATITLPAVPQGIAPTFTLTAVAIDNNGNASPPDEVSFSIGAPDADTPRVIMTHPLPLGGGDVVNDASNASTTWLNAEVVDPNGTPPEDLVVRFYANGQLIEASPRRVGNVFSLRAPLHFNSAGNYSFYARATDPEGNVGQAVPILLMVGELQAPMPTVEVLPVHGARAVLQPVPLYARVDPGLVNLDRVDFFINGVLVGSVEDSIVTNGTRELFTFDWTPQEDILEGAAATTVEVTARAVQIDPNGQAMDNWKISTPVPLDLKEKLFETPVASVTLTSPVDGADYDLGMQIPLIANITTTGAGTALQVDFYANGEIIGSATRAPFRVFWSPSVAGSYAVSAVLSEVGNVVLASAAPIRVDIDGGTSAPHFRYVGPALFGVEPTDPPTYPKVTAGSDVQLMADVAMMRDDGAGGLVPGDGNLAEVRFFVNGVEIGVADTQPFTTFWTPKTAGTYVLEAEAVDNAGRLRLYSQQYSVAQRTVAVTNPVGQVPTLSLGITASGNVTPGSRVVVQANVFDDDPDGVTVTFFMNGKQVGEPDTRAPFATILEPAVGVPPNIYTVTGLATDSDGNSRAVTLSPLYVSDVAVDHPGIEIVTPGAGAILTQGSRASLRANIVGGVDNIAQVIFYANGVRIGSVNSAPYSLDWLPDQLGPVEITAAVLQRTEQYDHDNNNFTPLILVTPVMVANPVAVTVNPPVGVLPSVSFQVLPAKENLAQGSQVILYADAQDLDGSIAAVEFFLDGVSLGAPVTSPPFALQWTARREGQFYINAVATDNEGNVVNSNFESVTVSSTVVSKTPAIDLTLPTTASQAGDFITLRSSVRDFVNGPEGVVFYIDGQPVGMAGVRPYNYIWEANLEGAVAVFATARQQLFNGTVVTTASIARTMTLAADEDPVVDFTVSWPGESAAKPNPLVNEPLTFTITATDNGRVETLELVRNGQTVRTVGVSATTMIVEEIPPSTGLYTYSVVATDNAGRQTASAGTEVSVVIGAIPTVVITTPAGGTSFLPSESITVRANAADTDGSVVGVQFYVNGVATGPVDTVAPYELVFTPGTSGAITLTARAEDNSGNFSELSAPVSILVPADEPPFFTRFAVNVGYGSGTSADPYVVRLGQGFSIATEADDANGLTSVTLTRNGATVAAPGGNAVPSQFFDELATPGIYGYIAEARDTGANVTTTARLFVKAITGSKPMVSITSPNPGAQVQAGVSVAIRVDATPAVEAEGPNGTITQVEFRANGTTFAMRTSPPYTAGFTPMSEGQWEISVVATSDTGVNSDEAIVTLNAIDEDLPEVVSFTNDTTGNQSLFGIPITFSVEARDEAGIRRVEFYRQGREEKIGEALSEPYTFRYTPYPLDGGTMDDDRIEAGIHLYYARVVNVGGLTTDSETVAITIRYPRPLENIEDFVFQSHLDLLLRVPSADERNAAVGRFDAREAPLDQDAASALVLSILESDEYVAVRSGLIAYRLLTGEWPDRHKLESGVRLIKERAGASFAALTNSERTTAVKELVRLLMPALEANYGKGLPTAASAPAEIDAFVAYLWEVKYGVPLANALKARELFRAFGRDDFVARFVLDVGNVVTPGGSSFSPILGFTNPPNDRILEWSNAAALFLNLLRLAPEQAAVEELAARLPASQVMDTFADPRYAQRFETADIALVHFDANWKESSWFGWYYVDPNSWNYHLELGWIWFQMEGQKPTDFWYYDLGTGWSWTRNDVNPYTYSSRLGRWLYRAPTNYEEQGGRRWFYDFEEEAWRNY